MLPPICRLLLVRCKNKILPLSFDQNNWVELLSPCRLVARRSLLCKNDVVARNQTRISSGWAPEIRLALEYDGGLVAQRLNFLSPKRFLCGGVCFIVSAIVLSDDDGELARCLKICAGV